MSHPLDALIPRPDARERFAITVRAPAAVVFRIACDFDVQSISLVRAIFWMRSKLMRTEMKPRLATGFLDEMRSIGWGRLVERRGEFVLLGAACQPWVPDVVFRAIPPDRFAEFAEPDKVKIAWTLEAESLGPELTRLATETRAVATDEQARKKFMHYWRWARFGIVPIRWLLLPAIGRAAVARWRTRHAASAW
jgi:hypothetical protein